MLKKTWMECRTHRLERERQRSVFFTTDGSQEMFEVFRL